MGFGLGWKLQGLGKDLGMTSHSGNKEEGTFFSFQTTKPRKKENSRKNLRKTKEKEGAKNQVVTNLTPLKKSRPRDLVAQGSNMNIPT